MNLEKGNPSKMLIPKGVKAQNGIHSRSTSYSILSQTSDEKCILCYSVSNDVIDWFLWIQHIKNYIENYANDESNYLKC